MHFHPIISTWFGCHNNTQLYSSWCPGYITSYRLH
jgi:hypothetical protein